MALVVPFRALPPSVGQAPENKVAVGFLRGVDLFTPFPIALGAGASVTSNEVWATGFDNFMLVVTTTAGGGITTSYQYNILDPTTLAILAVRTIALGAAGPATYVLTFGASSFNAPLATRGDTWIAFSLTITATLNAQSVSYLGLWCGVR